MKADLIYSLTDSFEAHSQQTESGVLFWLARDIQHLLDYTEWRNFTAVISKAKTACEVSVVNGVSIAMKLPFSTQISESGITFYILSGQPSVYDCNVMF